MILKIIKNHQGSTLLLTVLLLTAILIAAMNAASLTLTSAVIGGVQERSSLAFYAADSGVERALSDYRKNNFNYNSATSTLNIYSTTTLSNNSYYNVDYTSDCTTTTFVSTGVFMDAVRAVKVVSVNPDPCGGLTQITYNGDTYPIIRLCRQCWFAENLRTTKTPAGADITALAYCNASGCGSPWGRLYAWSTAMNISSTYDTTLWNGVTAIGAKIQGICPTGWHIPSDYGASASDDMQKLSNYLGGNSVSGGALKQTSTTYWNSPNTGATNSSGFAAVAAGNWESGSFNNRGIYAKLWTSSERNATNTWYRYLYYNDAALHRSYDYDKAHGFPVRCVKD